MPSTGNPAAPDPDPEPTSRRQPSVPRSWSTAFYDKFVAWWYLSLPGESCSYTVSRENIPLSDSVSLVADLYRPTTKPAGTILVRTPYGIGFPSFLAWRVLAARGYQVLVVACRGTAGSSGSFYLFRDEVRDGAATVAWMRKQEWYTGSFATIGGSYLGFTQWALLAGSHEDMRVAVIASGPNDLGPLTWGSGALSPFIIAWSVLMNHIYRGDPGPPKLLPTEETVKPIMDAVPLLDGVDKFFEGEAPPWLNGILTRSDLSDPFWADFRAGDGVDKAAIPTLLFTGWYDFIRPQVMDQYAKLSARGVTVGLTIGPWNHLEAQRQTKREEFDWLEEHFTRREGRKRKAPVRVYVTGAKQWRDMENWPPSGRRRDFYLGPQGLLGGAKPSEDAQASTFVFDPANPTPTVGTPIFTRMDGGKDDDSSLAERADVLTFTTAALERSVEVLGRPEVEIFHTSSQPEADLLVRLCEVDASGRSHNVAERFLRLPETREQPLRVELSDCAHRFCPGTRLRLVVAGGSHPQYLRNFGTREEPAKATEMKSATHVISHSAGSVSRIILPEYTVT
jgi:uncharacterized protein